MELAGEIMDDYIEKMQDMLAHDYSMRQVAENLYLNYHSVINTDEVYRLRKSISIKYKCNLNDVKLIGSAHTGYTYKDKKLQKRDNPEDYDFAIISASVFTEFFHKVNIDEITEKEKKLYVEGILQGKLHPLHADKKFLEKVEKINRNIMKEEKVTKHVSICFYLSEQAFIDGLVNFNTELYTGELLRISKKRDAGASTIGALINMSEIMAVDKMEE